MSYISPLEMPRTLLDFETRSELDLRSCGVWRYAEHPSTEIISLAYKIAGEKETKLWAPPMPFPQELVDAAEDDCHVFEAHNTSMEAAIWLRILNGRLGIPTPRRWVDTMASCAYRALPMGLDEVGTVLDLGIKKDKRGKYLIQQLCKPRKPLKKEREAFEAQGLTPDQWPTLWREDWALLEEMYGYNIDDVAAEECLGKTIGDLPLPEYRLWTLDQRINFRGVQVDSEAVECAVGIVELLQEKFQAELIEITGGEVQTANQRDKMLAWLSQNGLVLENMQAETVENEIKRLGNWIQDGTTCFEEIKDVYRVLEIRQILGSASLKKLYKFMECLCDDDRLRGLLQYHGAGTGRWAGRLVQPQNFPRGDLEDYAENLGCSGDVAMELLIDCIKLGGQDAVDMIEELFGNITDALVTSLRGMFISAPGKIFRIADFAAIEAVVTSWLAGEEWKLEAFRTIQSGEKYNGADDIYCATASKILGRVITKKDKKERQGFGKVPELAFGYQGGIGAWRNFDKSDTMRDEEIDHIKNQWRDEHPATRNLWYGLEGAAVDALQLDKPVRYRNIVFEPVEDAAGKWLTAILPNGRRLWYFDPELEYGGQWYGKPKYQVTYQGRDNKKGGRWGRVRTYGGMLTENVVQAISRDIMAEAMIRVERAGYSIVMTIHDEIIVENVPEHGSQEEFEALMSEVPIWAKGCPVSVAGWIGTRYRKD